MKFKEHNSQLLLMRHELLACFFSVLHIGNTCQFSLRPHVAQRLEVRYQKFVLLIWLINLSQWWPITLGVSALGEVMLHTGFVVISLIGINRCFSCWWLSIVSRQSIANVPNWEERVASPHLTWEGAKLRKSALLQSLTRPMGERED